MVGQGMGEKRKERDGDREFIDTIDFKSQAPTHSDLFLETSNYILEVNFIQLLTYKGNNVSVNLDPLD